MLYQLSYVRVQTGYRPKVLSTFGQTPASENDSPPEPGFARREAHRHKNTGCAGRAAGSAHV
jgi:hypothetical protein